MVFKGPGVYPMGEYRGVNSFGVFTSVYEDGTFDQFYSGESSGTLNITSYDEASNTITGDFNFSAVSSTDNSIIIKDGFVLQVCNCNRRQIAFIPREVIISLGIIFLSPAFNSL